MPARRLAALLPLALAACAPAKLNSTLPPDGLPASYVGAHAGGLAPEAVAPALAAFERTLAPLAKRGAAVPLSVEREGVALKLRFGVTESFDGNSAELQPAALAAYAGLAQALASPGTVAHIRVLGPADGEPATSLAARRAAAVQAYLAARGVPGTRLRAHGDAGDGAVEVLVKPIVAGRETEAWVPPS